MIARASLSTWLPAALAAVLSAAVMAGSGDASAPTSAPWRGGWCGLADLEKLVECAKETHFDALIAHGPKERMKVFSERARENEIESYYWSSLTTRGEEVWRRSNGTRGSWSRSRTGTIAVSRASPLSGCTSDGKVQTSRPSALLRSFALSTEWRVTRA